MDEIGNAVLQTHHDAIITWQQIIDPFEEIMPFAQNALIAAIGG